MDFISILTVVSGALSAILGLFVARAAARSNEEREATLVAARQPKVHQALYKSDLKSLGDYFFETLGRLPLSEYADDREARSIVSGAVRNVDDFVNADRSSLSADPDRLGHFDATRAEADIAMGDFWGGLSRLRRLIESSLRDVASDAGIAVGKRGPNQLLRRLVAVDAIPRSAEAPLRRAIAICNRGVHGEPISGEDVEAALALAADGLSQLEKRNDDS